MGTEYIVLAVAAAAAAASAGVQAYSSYEQGRADRKAADFNAQQAIHNAQQQANYSRADADISDANAARVLQEATFRDRFARRKQDRQTSRVASATSVRGWGLDSLSFEDWLSAEISVGEEERAFEYFQAVSTAEGHRTSSRSRRLAADVGVASGHREAYGLRMGGQAAFRSGQLGAVGAGIGGVSSTLSLFA